MKVLRVHFKNTLPEGWKNSSGGPLTNAEEILQIANEWHQSGVNANNDVVPKFILCENGEAPDIIVEFRGKEDG